ncbi:preprotein translocase subunit YajC [Lentisphaerota bacterium WC36G]|nr:preprotein translocase subunit YajC [Lentisphaerae bacterium WC36]
MQSYFTTIAVADAPPTTGAKDGKAQGPANNGMAFLLPMAIIFGAMIFIQMRSAKKQKKQREDMMSATKVGDKIVTIGGLHGKIAAVKEETYMIEIAPGTKIEISKAGVGTVINSNGEQNIDNKIEDADKQS